MMTENQFNMFSSNSLLFLNLQSCMKINTSLFLISTISATTVENLHLYFFYGLPGLILLGVLCESRLFSESLVLLLLIYQSDKLLEGFSLGQIHLFNYLRKLAEPKKQKQFMSLVVDN